MGRSLLWIPGRSRVSPVALGNTCLAVKPDWYSGTKRKHGKVAWMEMPKPSPAHCGSYWLVSNDILHLFMSLGGVNHGSSLEKCRFLAQ